MQTRIDPRCLRTKKLIRDALECLLEEKRFSELSVQEIAERATINRATFYAHFADKYALLEDFARERYRKTLAEHDPLEFADVCTLVHTVAHATFLDVAREKCMVDREFEAQLERALQGELHRFLHDALGDAGALVVSSAVVGAALRWRADHLKEPVEELILQLVTVLAGGVRLNAPIPETAVAS
jgi:AcrR family transcriptional regulator